MSADDASTLPDLAAVHPARSWVGVRMLPARRAPRD